MRLLVTSSGGPTDREAQNDAADPNDASGSSPSGRRLRAAPRIPGDEVPPPTPAPPDVVEAVPLMPTRIITLDAPTDPVSTAEVPKTRSSLPPAPGTQQAHDPGWTPLAPTAALTPDIEELSPDDVSPDSQGPAAAGATPRKQTVPPPPPPRPPSMSRPDVSPTSGVTSSQRTAPLDPPPPRPPTITRPDGAIPPPARAAGLRSTLPQGVKPPAVEAVPPEAASDLMEITATELPADVPPPKPPPRTSGPPPASQPEREKPAQVAPHSEPSSEMRSERKKRPWWEDLFGDDFLRTMERTSERQILREVVFIEDRLGLQKGAVVLDLACGAGRHAVELTRRGYKVVGYDLSLAMLARASDEAEEAGQRINFLHGDMRDMAFDSMFDGIYCWNHSFGYFDEEKNVAVLSKIHRALRPGGVVLLDLLNRDFIAPRQPSMVWFEGEGCVCMDEMQVDSFTSRLKVKRTVMLDDGRSREIDYTIRLYPLHELGKMLHDCGFKVLEVSGQLATPGVFFGADSPRCIILAERA